MNDLSTPTGPGETLRSVRRSNNWTLAEVASRAGIPLSTLSKIEIGQISPTYEQLMRLSESLNIDIAELFGRRGKGSASIASGGRRSINRLNSGEIIETQTRVQCYLSTDLLNKQVTPIISEVKARSLQEFGEFMHHPGEEFVYVIEGELELHTDGYAPVILQTGESIYFESSMGHAYLAHTDKPCRFLCICTVVHETHAGAVSPPAKPVGQITVAGSRTACTKPEAGTVAARRDPRRVNMRGRRGG